jgi:hypothetical protein
MPPPRKPQLREVPRRRAGAGGTCLRTVQEARPPTIRRATDATNRSTTLRCPSRNYARAVAARTGLSGHGTFARMTFLVPWLVFPLLLEPQTAETVIAPTRPSSLCGRPLDWAEVVPYSQCSRARARTARLAGRRHPVGGLAASEADGSLPPAGGAWPKPGAVDYATRQLRRRPRRRVHERLRRRQPRLRDVTPAASAGTLGTCKRRPRLTSRRLCG